MTTILISDNEDFLRRIPFIGLEVIVPPFNRSLPSRYYFADHPNARIITLKRKRVFTRSSNTFANCGTCQSDGRINVEIILITTGYL